MLYYCSLTTYITSNGALYSYTGNCWLGSHEPQLDGLSRASGQRGRSSLCRVCSLWINWLGCITVHRVSVFAGAKKRPKLQFVTFVFTDSLEPSCETHGLDCSWIVNSIDQVQKQTDKLCSPYSKHSLKNTLLKSWFMNKVHGSFQ